MDIGAPIHPVAGYPSLARKAAYPASARAAQETAGAPPARRTSDGPEVEALLRHRHSRMDWRQAFPDQRSRRALEAYAALEEIQQRDYVSQVLGIDEYV